MFKNNQETPQAYNSADMYDAHSLAKEHLSWVNALISTVIQNNQTGKTGHNQELLSIARHLSDIFADAHDSQSEVYKAEIKANKKVVTL